MPRKKKAAPAGKKSQRKSPTLPAAPPAPAASPPPESPQPTLPAENADFLSFGDVPPEEIVRQTFAAAPHPAGPTPDITHSARRTALIMAPCADTSQTPPTIKEQNAALQKETGEIWLENVKGVGIAATSRAVLDGTRNGVSLGIKHEREMQAKKSPPLPPSVDVEDEAILRVLASDRNLHRRLTQAQIAGQTEPRIGLRTINNRMPGLLQLALVACPHGKKSGYVITPMGREVVKSLAP
jgi:hypothetical protein